jgi:hypothetical protein
MIRFSDFKSYSPSALKLPGCVIPRPGEKVRFRRGKDEFSGVLTGYNLDGQPLMDGRPRVGSIFQLGLQNPFERVGPNWMRLPGRGRIWEPPKSVKRLFSKRLSKRIPPGLTFLQLMDEFRSRGFEVFVVGGTVRDILSGSDAKDIDIVTTTPGGIAHTLMEAIFRDKCSWNPKRGYISIGPLASLEVEHIDLKFFSDSFVGSRHATFGSCFTKDLEHRDFACNSVYYEPFNEVLIDPSGHGVEDCLERYLNLVHKKTESTVKSKIFWRAFKFLARDFEPGPGMLRQLRKNFLSDLDGVDHRAHLNYIRTQVCKKAGTEAKLALTKFGSKMREYDFEDVWETYVAPFQEEILNVLAVEPGK